jgi:hypothetical protein
MINRGWTPPILRIVRLFMMDCREGEKDPLVHDWGRPASVRPRRGALSASQETCHACQAQSLLWNVSSAASTEVVMAQDEFFSAFGRLFPGIDLVLVALAFACERA